jgi:hypothetical protein
LKQQGRVVLNRQGIIVQQKSEKYFLHVIVFSLYLYRCFSPKAYASSIGQGGLFLHLVKIMRAQQLFLIFAAEYFVI